MRIAWPLMFRWLHEALIEGALDRAETATTGTPVKGRPWPLSVRLLRTALRRQRGRAGRRIVQDPKRQSPAAYRVTVERRGDAPLEAQLVVRAASKRAAGELASWIAERKRGGMFETTKVQLARRNEITDFDDADL